jgi:poly(beta-D-mannuronate) C5 epimerase
MHCKSLLLAIAVGLIVAPWPLAASATAKPLAGARPALPSLPDLDGWETILDGLEPPRHVPGEVKIRPVQQEPALAGSFTRAARAMPEWGGEAVVIEHGVHTLEQAATAAGRPDLLRCRQDGCELRAPLLVHAGAGLVIGGSRHKPLRVRLHQEAGAFAINAGVLHVERVSLLGWSSSKGALAETGGKGFRPFVAAFGGSRTAVLRAELVHLGFEGAKAYGFTLSSHPRLFPGEQPSARVFASRFHQLYYGLYTYEARSVVVIGNVFSDSDRYGIDPHDASSDLLIARNEIHGARDHGVILSGDVHDSWVVGNLSRDNAGSGLLLDGGSRGNAVINNRLVDNVQDGIAVYESHDNVIAFNRIERNGRVGIRVRGSAANVVANNVITGSGGYGLEAYDWADTARPLPPEKAKDQRPVSLTLFGNSFADNAKGACRFKTVREVIAYADDAGLLRPCGKTVTIPDEEATTRVWRQIPGTPDAVRLVPADE